MSVVHLDDPSAPANAVALAGSAQPDLKSDAAPQDRGRPFEIVSDFAPAGDQPSAIGELVGGVREGEMDQVLLGVTGSGKTFTMLGAAGAIDALAATADAPSSAGRDAAALRHPRGIDLPCCCCCSTGS